MLLYKYTKKNIFALLIFLEVMWSDLLNPTKIFPRLGRFYPFSILAKTQTQSEFEAILTNPTGKKDNSKDK